MIMRVRTQLLALEHCWSISTGSCLTTLLTGPISLRATTLFASLKNWFGLQCFNNNEEFVEVVKNVAELTGGRLF
jgi:hypothetical protein